MLYKLIALPGDIYKGRLQQGRQDHWIVVSFCSMQFAGGFDAGIMHAFGVIIGCNLRKNRGAEESES